MKHVNTADAPAAIGPYSQATIANGFLFSAGQIALDPSTGQVVDGDIDVQTERVMRNLQAVLDAAGATWNDVVKGPITVSNTGGWTTWTTIRKNGVTLSAGPQQIRLVMDTNGPTMATGNFNWIRIALPGQ